MAHLHRVHLVALRDHMDRLDSFESLKGHLRLELGAKRTTFLRHT